MMRYVARLMQYVTPDELQFAIEFSKDSNDTYKDILTRASFGTLYTVELPDGTLYHPADHSYQPEPEPEPGEMPWALVKQWDFAVDGATNAIDYVLAASETEIFVIGEAVTTSLSAVRQLVVSEDGGSTFKTTLGNYKTWSTNGVPGDQTGFPIPETGSTTTLSTAAWFIGLNQDQFRMVMHMTTSFVGGGMYVQSFNKVNAIRLRPTAGNFNGGRYYILAR